MTYAAGDVYEGRWVNDKKNGSGVYHYASKREYEGIWLDDVPKCGTYISVGNQPTLPLLELENTVAVLAAAAAMLPEGNDTQRGSVDEQVQIEESMGSEGSEPETL